MPNFWESSANPAFHGYLKLGESQSLGIDVHGTFPKDGALPHISIYEGVSKIERNLYLRNANGTVGLSERDRISLRDSAGVNEDVINAFIRTVYDKHRELNPIKVSVGTSSVFNINSSDFPALQKPHAPLLANRSISVTPRVLDPIQQQLDNLPASVRSVVLASGAFDD